MEQFERKFFNLRLNFSFDEMLTILLILYKHHVFKEKSLFHKPSRIKKYEKREPSNNLFIPRTENHK